MSLFAQEPVPGNSQDYAKRTSSEFHKNKDLSRCVNLRSAEVVLGVYSKDNTSLQNKFFRQMAPHLIRQSVIQAYIHCLSPNTWKLISWQKIIA